MARITRGFHRLRARRRLDRHGSGVLLFCALHEPSAMTGPSQPAPEQAQSDDEHPLQDALVERPAPREIGGRDGLDPTRYGDWEKNGRCIDF